MDKRRGQLVALAVFLLAFLLLASISKVREMTPEPQILIRRDWAQATSVATLGRLWIVFASARGFFCPRFKNSTSHIFYALNKTYSLNIPPLSNVTILEGEGNETSGYTRYIVRFYRLDKGGHYVTVDVLVEYALNGTYYKVVEGEMVLYKLYHVTYRHLYIGPWGTLRVCDLELKDPAGKADVERVGECNWLVGFPAKAGNYTLTDKFGISVGVGWAWEG